MYETLTSYTTNIDGNVACASSTEEKFTTTKCWGRRQDCRSLGNADWLLWIVAVGSDVELESFEIATNKRDEHSPNLTRVLRQNPSFRKHGFSKHGEDERLIESGHFRLRLV